MATKSKYSGISVNDPGHVVRCIHYGDHFIEPLQEKQDITKCAHAMSYNPDNDSYTCRFTSLTCNAYKHLKEKFKRETQERRASERQERENFQEKPRAPSTQTILRRKDQQESA
jgi:hypothetical protein